MPASPQRTLAMLALLSLGGSPAAAGGPPSARADAGADISFGSLTYYADCVNTAHDRFSIFRLDRYLLYRCDGDVAIAYFNYLGRRDVPDRFAQQPEGTFIFRTIRGKGRCWNMVADEFGRPVSIYGCEIFEQI